MIGRRTIALTTVLLVMGGIAWLLVSLVNRVQREVEYLGNGHALIPYAEKGDAAKVRELVSQGAHMNMINSLALRLAAEKGHEEVVTVLLDGGAWVNATPYAHKTPLTAAVSGGKSAIVRLLLERGADPNLRDAGGQLPLVLAAKKGKSEIVRLLLNAGADPGTRDRAGSTALNAARARGDRAVAGLLRKRVPTQ